MLRCLYFEPRAGEWRLAICEQLYRVYDDVLAVSAGPAQAAQHHHHGGGGGGGGGGAGVGWGGRGGRGQAGRGLGQGLKRCLWTVDDGLHPGNGIAATGWRISDPLVQAEGWRSLGDGCQVDIQVVDIQVVAANSS
jgi:hypothetical protein